MFAEGGLTLIELTVMTVRGGDADPALPLVGSVAVMVTVPAVTPVASPGEFGSLIVATVASVELQFTKLVMSG